jgi:hypothetical protein
MTRSDIYSTFVKRFSRPRRKPVAPVSADEVSTVEKEVGTIFPAPFVTFITAHGPVFCPEILDLVVDAQESGSIDFEGWDVAEFLVPSEIPKTHAMYARGGMDGSLMAVPHSRGQAADSDLVSDRRAAPFIPPPFHPPGCP